MEPRNFEIKFCPVCGQPAMPGHVCGPATAKAAAAETAQFDERGFPLNDAARAQRDRVPPHIPVPPPLPGARPPSHSAAPRRNIFEILLDPRSIQWLLALGGVLLFTGLVVWLRSLGIFENAFVVAGLLGIGTLALLAGGWSIIRFTRFQLAGRAVTLLACLVMPLNLWFYHANDLLTLDGNLWMAAVVCCVLYAASAWVLKDPLFVYVLMAGIAGTGLLILTDMHKFAEIASPSLLLVILGILAIHAERAFPQSETEFSRKRFGLAFFFSGHALLAGGLLLLLGAQLAAWLVQPIFPHWDIPSSVVTTDPTLKLLALAIVLAGTYAYVYSDLFVRKVGAYIYPAAFTLLWAELLALKMLNLTYGSELILATASITALALNVLYGLVAGNQPRLSRHISPLALLLAILPVLYGLLLFGHATYEVLHARWEYQIGWGYVGAMIVCALACRAGAFVQRANNPTMARTYFIFTGAATLLAAAGLLHVFHIDVWSSQVPILMLIPIAYLIASRCTATMSSGNRCRRSRSFPLRRCSSRRWSPRRTSPRACSSRSKAIHPTCCWRSSSWKARRSMPRFQRFAAEHFTSSSPPRWPAARCGNCSVIGKPKPPFTSSPSQASGWLCSFCRA